MEFRKREIVTTVDIPVGEICGSETGDACEHLWGVKNSCGYFNLKVKRRYCGPTREYYWLKCDRCKKTFKD